MRAVRRIRQSIRRVVERDADHGARGDAAGASVRNVNISEPRNVVISHNTGDESAAHGVSSRQRVRVRQDGNESYEETETTETRL